MSNKNENDFFILVLTIKRDLSHFKNKILTRLHKTNNTLMASNYLNTALFIVTIILLFSNCKKKENALIQYITRDEAVYQMQYPILQKALHKKGIHIKQVEIFLRAFKYEQKLEVWIKEKTQEQFIFFKSYDFCRTSGKLGPKRKEGDYQIPEGLYHINVFNPLSNFHLSLGINYPNDSDKILGDTLQPGSDIYIHGGCMTVGCIPITNKNIKELYTVTSIAHKNDQEQIPIHIFPFRMKKQHMQKWNTKYPSHTPFWNNLQIFYDFFEKEKTLPSFKITEEGIYKPL
jgi:murein L,D-transpeptidase YafK